MPRSTKWDVVRACRAGTTDSEKFRKRGDARPRYVRPKVSQQTIYAKKACVRPGPCGVVTEIWVGARELDLE